MNSNDLGMQTPNIPSPNDVSSQLIWIWEMPCLWQDWRLYSRCCPPSLISIQNGQSQMIQCFRGWMKGSPKQMDNHSQPVLPMGSKIVQRWTAVPRAGHIGSEITHSFMAPSGFRDSLTWPSSSRQTVGSAKFVTRSVTNRHFFRLQGASRVKLFFSLWWTFCGAKTLDSNKMCIWSPMFTASSKMKLFPLFISREEMNEISCEDALPPTRDQYLSRFSWNHKKGSDSPNCGFSS